MIITPNNQNNGQQRNQFGTQQQQQPNQNQFGVNQQQQMQQQMMSFLGGNTGGAGASIDWSQTEAQSYKDPALEELRKQSGLDDEMSASMMIARVTDPMMFFLQSVNSRTGVLYNTYMDSINNFRMDPCTRGTCPVASAFIDVLVANPRNLISVMKSVSVYFGYSLVDIIKKSNSVNSDVQPFTQQNYLDCTAISTRNVLFLEMIRWLDSTTKGKSFAYSLPPEISRRLPNIEEYKVHASRVFAFFNLQSPFDDIKFQLESFTAQHNLNQETSSNEIDYSWFETTPVNRNMPNNEGIFKQVDEAAARYRAREHQQVNYSVPQHEEQYDGGYSWENKQAQNISKITKATFDNYNLRKWMKAIPGRKNEYVVSGKDWLYIERAITPYYEDKCFYGTVVVVTTNIEAIRDGYSSRMVKLPKGVPYMDVLTDPSKILPVLEEDPESGLVVVAMNEEEALLNAKQEKDLGDVIIPEHNEGVVVTAYAKQEVNESDPTKMLEVTEVMNKTLVGKTKSPIASQIKVNSRGPLWTSNEGSSAWLYSNLPSLYFSKSSLGEISYYNEIKYIKRMLTNLDDVNLKSFITFRLTKQLNDLFVNHYGYSNDPNDPNVLYLDNVLEEIDELNELVMVHDQRLYEDLNMVKSESRLLSTLKLFEKEPETPEDEMSKAVQSKRVIVAKNIVVYTLNNLPTPDSASSKLKHVTYSEYPSLFKITDKLTNPDKVLMLRFDDSEELWEMTRNVYSDDKAVIRLVDNETSLSILDYDS